jgi:hypothetical protein
LLVVRFSYCQQRDFTGLTGITVSKNINRAWDVSLGTQAMFNQNLHELWFVFTDGSIGYRINRNLNTELHTRIIQFRQLDNTYSRRNLYYHTLTWSKSYGKWGFSLRNRLQQLVYGEHFNDAFKGPVWYNRNRIAVRYAKHRPADGRLDGFWPVWGFWTMSAATLLLTAGIAKLKMHKCSLDWDGRPLVKKP